TGLTAGTYNLTITDANNCSTTQSVIITQPAAALSATMSAQTDVACFGADTGSATVSAIGGTAPYTYSWNTNPIQTSATASNLIAGSYMVTVTDANGCITTQNVMIAQPTAALAAPTASAIQPTCNIVTGSIEISGPKGTDLSYSIDGTNYQASTSFTTVAPGNYLLTVRNNAGCTSESTSITINNIPSAPGIPAPASITQPNCTLITGTITFTTQTGVEYSIDNGINYQRSEIFNNLSPGPYNLRVRSTTDNTCFSNGAAAITINSAICAANDTPPAIGGGNGGTTPSVLDNDILNGIPVTQTTVTLSPGTSPQAGISMNPDGTVTVAPNTPAGTYTYPYTICDKVNPNNCSTAGTTITVNPPAIVASNDTPPAIGANGGKIPSVLDNDTLNGNPVSLTSITLSPGTSPNPGLVMTSDGTVTVAPNTPAGTYIYPYTICDQVNPNNCSTGSTTVTVNPPAIVASNDMPPAIGGGNGGTTPSVLDNDTLNGNPVSPTTVTLTPGTSPQAGISMNPDGTVAVAPNTPAGTYTYPYTICDKVNPNNCSTASTTITVTPPAIVASNDTPPAIGGGNGGVTPSVLDNDTLNGNPVSLTTVTLTPGTSPNPGLVMNPDGTVSVAPNTPAGTYTYPYTICDKVNPNNCSTASTTITVNPPAIVATNDTPPAIGGSNGGTTPSVLDNDTLNGIPVSPTTVTLSPGTSPQAGISMNPDGTVTVAPNTPAGTYTYPYTICDKVNPNNCSTASTTITVNPPAIVATNDAPPAIGVNGGKTPSVLDDDTLNGNPVSLTTVTLTPGTSPNAGLLMNPDGTVTVAPNTPAGTYSYSYTICDKANPNNCSTAIALIVVEAPNFHIPNLFTPNGDGNNDTFEIIGLDQFAQNKLVIVNRWGNEVYHADGYQNNWTGEGLNEGTYYYLLKVKKSGDSDWSVYKGYITLIRAFKK
ncbi:gliding motility-associated C-terminal domain-containing protein, partial [Pedobacter nototheniae]|uniref:T9SS type B sorting domain-containing protein n=1 Tax=Pedobacter nototheniae TaxID=2488994 RepID=UPI00292CFECE